ncbi:HEAT repeat domain-containing protein [Actinoplanes sp. CA-051413]|uniref:HEAT repeat domain-containing protein n=1 Tax=Actinoplanes sp. CA-051413 TaxID=3239899 RepID=UPI003D9980FC
MDTVDPGARYRDYLATFGIAEPGDRVVERHGLGTGYVRFFAYLDAEGLRLKAAVTPDAMVRPGGHSDDDWYGFLAGMPSAAVAAERIAWLETTAVPPHALPMPPVVALVPGDRPAAGIDPAQLALVTSPSLHRSGTQTLVLIAWLLAGGARVPQRWTVIARAGTSADVSRVSAFELLATRAAGAAAAAAEAEARARQLLVSGTDDQRRWALHQVAEVPAIPAVAAVLADLGADADLRLIAAGTLARIADPAVVVPLRAALRTDPAAEVRRGSAQAIGRIGGAEAISALAEAASREPDMLVRMEIVHALRAQGAGARAVLAGIADGDPDAAVRQLARYGFDSIR